MGRHSPELVAAGCTEESEHMAVGTVKAADMEFAEKELAGQTNRAGCIDPAGCIGTAGHTEAGYSLENHRN